MTSRQQHQQHQHQQHEYHALLEDVPDFTAPEDLDGFLHVVYAYHQAGGRVPAAVKALLDVLQMLFTASIVTFLLCFVDFEKLSSVERLRDAIAYQGLSPWFGLLLASFVAYFVWFTLASLSRLWRLMSIRDFYSRILRIDDARLRQMDWSQVLERLTRVPRLCRTHQSVTALDITNRIMRVDNYVIAMINKGLLPIPQWAVKWIGGSQLLATNALEIAFRAAVLPILMHYAASCSATPGGSVTARRSLQMRQAASSIRARARLGALLCIVISPFVSLYLFVHTMVKYVAALSTQPAVVAARQWTPLARWRYREFNELPHEFRKRLNRAYEPAQRYCESFPVYWLAVPASFLSFVVSGFVFALVVLSLIDDNVMINADVALGRSGVWWLTVLGSALALLRSVAPDPNAVYSPDEHLAAVCKVTHYMPQRWRNRAGDAAVRREFARDYDYRFAVLVRELLSIAIAPVLLAWYVPRIAEPLVHFVDISTVNVAGVGSVCQLALFRLTAGGGDPLYGSPATGAAPEGGLRAQDGKLEKSLLLFRANHPQWRAPAESRGLVDNLRQFAERRLGTPARAVPSDGDEFDQLMQASAGLAAAPARPAASARRRGGAAALRATAELDDNVDPMEALTEVIEQYHAERAAAAGERNDAAIDDSADFDAGPVRPLDWQQPPV